MGIFSDQGSKSKANCQAVSNQTKTDPYQSWIHLNHEAIFLHELCITFTSKNEIYMLEWFLGKPPDVILQILNVMSSQLDKAIEAHKIN